MATILQSLKLSAVQRSRQVSPVIARRNKLLKAIHEQCKAAEAAQQGQRYTVKTTRRIRNKITGESMDVLKDKRVRECWWLGDDGKLYLQLRYGYKPLEFGKGKVTIEVGEMANLVSVLETLRDAAMLGEFDDQLQVASSRLAEQLKAKRGQ